MGQLVEPPLVRAALHKQRRRARLKRRYATRMPWGYLAHRPGDLIQIDTRPIPLYPGCQRVHITARDVVSRKDVVAAYKQGNSAAAEQFLRHELPRMGFPIRALQIDGGVGIQGELRAGLPGAENRPVCPAAPESPLERQSGAGASDPPGGVLRSGRGP